MSVTEFESSILPGPPLVHFSASSTLHRHGMFVSSSMSAEGDPTNFSITRAEGTPESANVEPPAPFRGSAHFRLESPTASTWLGDLGVELPGVGKVALAGPEFWSAICESTSCTDTLPPGVHISFLVA
jgi:hypothetical protein